MVADSHSRRSSFLGIPVAGTRTCGGLSLASLRGTGALVLCIRPRGDELELLSVFYGVLDLLPDGHHQIGNTAGVAILGQSGELADVNLPVLFISMTNRRRGRGRVPDRKRSYYNMWGVLTSGLVFMHSQVLRRTSTSSWLSARCLLGFSADMASS